VRHTWPVSQEVAKQRLSGGRVTLRSGATPASHPPATRELRIWAWLSLFPAVFVFAVMLISWMAEIGVLLTLGLVAAIGLGVVAVVRFRGR
jgi:hypothetical protein